jgi:hypothetical protein
MPETGRPTLTGVPFEPLPMTEETLISLLNEGTERAGLDYKRRLDLSTTKDTVSIVKDFGAMQVEGGYIVVGADDNGRSSGLVTEAEAILFDQATVHSKVERYLAEGFDIRCTKLELDGARYGLICVLPHPDGFAPFRVDGVYRLLDGTDKTDFRKGEVFARHGSKSERWDQSDIRKAVETIRRQERERAREEFQTLLRTISKESGDTQAASASISALSFNLDIDTLVESVLEQLRRQDEIPLKLLLTRAGEQAARHLAEPDDDGLDGLLDRLVSLAGAFMTVERLDLVERVISVLLAVYNQGFDERGIDKMMPIAPFDLHFRIITRVQALGALAVRQKQWPTLREVVLQRPDVYQADYWQNWIRRAMVMAARAGVLHDPDDERAGISPLLIAQEHIVRLTWLRPGLSPDDDGIITNLCRFDLLYCLTAYGADPKRRLGEFLPNFARWFSHRSDPAVVEVIEDPALRKAIFPYSDQELADALRLLGEQARMMSFPFGGWTGYEDPRITAFLQRFPPT